MKEYATSDVANIVGIAKPTVNKYSLALEKEGYKILRNERGHRVYTDEDIQILGEIKKQSDDTGMSVERIANMLVLQQKRNTSVEDESISDITTLKENEAKIVDTIYPVEEMKLFFHQELEVVKESLREELNEKLNEQRQFFEEKFRALERDRELDQSIRRSLEEKREVAATAEDVAAQEKKPGLIAGIKRLFGK